MLPPPALLIWIASVGLLQAESAITSQTSPLDTCGLIANVVSDNSAVFFPDDSEYVDDNAHFAVSAAKNSTCSVEPGTAADIGSIVKILASTRTPFAIKGGGHNLNPGFSSTSGVQLSMARFNQVIFHAESQTVDIGSGLVWDQVYADLEPYNVSVVGGRATGVGVAGLLLGGGYSYKTNQYGLAVDSITAFELVLPSGKVQTITQKSDQDLFFALRGGGNNFGIVTKFTMKTHPQPTVWGGSITYAGAQGDAVTTALLNYTEKNTDPQTGLQCTYASFGGQDIVMVNLFYNEPAPPAGIFDAFLAIPAISSNVSARSYLSLIQSANTDLTAGMRGLYSTVSHTAVTLSLTTAMRNETNFYGALLQPDTLVLNGYVIEPFLPDAYHRGLSPTAYPPDRSENIHPMNIYYAWTDTNFDEVMLKTSRASTRHLQNVAAAEGILASAMYPNYALFGTPLERFYGENIDRLREIKGRVDPFDVMSLTGGFKL
ncbi:FAD-binding domain-containing protein [Mycena polygramma]|nr:FAD-binding domain-containing protein [Mycena polygramma]